MVRMRIRGPCIDSLQLGGAGEREVRQATVQLDFPTGCGLAVVTRQGRTFQLAQAGLKGKLHYRDASAQ